MRRIVHDPAEFAEVFSYMAESNCGLLILDSSRRIQSVNRTVEELFGYGREELAGAPIEILLPEPICSQDSVRGLRKDGVRIPLHVHLNPIETEAGELTLCTLVDIAERVQYERQLELARHAAEAANMNLILGMNALVLESPLSEKQRQHAEISYSNVRRLLLEAIPFDLNEVLKDCAATTSSAIEQKGLRLELSIDPGAWRYWIGDSERLQQVLLNLIGNSIKFTARGKIEVRVFPEAGAKGEKGLRLEVSDTGCGVPPDQAGIIFDAFQQAEGRTYEGTGLGLAIAKTLVEMMSGRIWLEEREGPGSKFVFTVVFPSTAEEAVPKQIRGIHVTQAVRRMEAGARILLVEDNRENMILLRAYLENLPLELDFATNGLEAVERRRQRTYDLLMMDIQMPMMDGLTATREIRAWEKEHKLSRVPIVALTAHALSGAFEASIEAGCDGHLTKPVERNDLLEVIAKFAKRPVFHREEVPALIAARQPAFLANRQLDLIKLRGALAAGDFATIQNIGHNCKGTGQGYGFPEISTSGSAIEIAAKALDADALQGSIRDFELCLLAAAAP